MRIEIITEWNEVQRSIQAWKSLLDRVSDHSFYQTFEWHDCWWKSFGKGRMLYFVVFKEEQSWEAILPLAITKQTVNQISERVCRIIGSANLATDYGDFIVTDQQDSNDMAHKVTEFLVSSKRPWTVLDLINLREDGWIMKHAKPSFLQKGLFFTECQIHDAPTIFLDHRFDEKNLSKKSIRRNLNYFQSKGSLTFQKISIEQALKTDLVTFFGQHIRRRALTLHPSQFLSSSQRMFFEALIQKCPQWIHFCSLEFEERPIAFHFGFEYQGVFYWYKPSFAPRFQRKSPGQILLKFLIEDVRNRAFKEFDFTVGGESFKYRFANHSRGIYRIRVFNKKFSYFVSKVREKISGCKHSMRTFFRRYKEKSNER